jgi:hypothetical protein
MAMEWRLLDLYVDLNENSVFLNPAIQRARMEGLVPDTVTFCSIKKIGISLGRADSGGRPGQRGNHRESALFGEHSLFPGYRSGRG